MARKSDVLTVFPQFITLVEHQFNTTVKNVQSDGSREFLNKVLKNYFISKGIIHRLSCPSTPEQT